MCSFCGFYFVVALSAPGGSGLPSVLSARRGKDEGRRSGHKASILEVVGDDGEATLQRYKRKSRAVQADLEQIHLLSRKMSVGVDISEAPLQSKGDKIGLSRQSGRKLEAILLENGHLPRRANLGGSVVRVAVDSVFAEHGLAEARVRAASREAATVVSAHSSVEGADVTVEEGARRVGAHVVSAAVGNARLGEGILKEGDDIGRHDVGDEGRLLLEDSCRLRRGSVLVPSVHVVGVDGRESVDEVLEDDLLVGSGRVGLPKGSDLLHGVVEEGGIGLGQARLNCGHFSRF